MALDDAQVALLCSRSLPICADGDMVFTEPWEAKAFAIVVTLSQTGYFTWSEWVDCFAEHVAKATSIEAAGGVPKTYYEQWVDAAESILVSKGITSAEQLVARRLGALQAATKHVNSPASP